MHYRLASILALAAGASVQGQERPRVPFTCTYPPFPEGVGSVSDMCLQRNFLTADKCADVNATLIDTNTLLLAGWQCCSSIPPFAPPPAVSTGLWVKVDANGTVLDRCLGAGECNSPCPAGLGYAIGTCNVTLPPFPCEPYCGNTTTS